MRWVVIGGIIILLIPFYVYLLSRVMMLGWLQALKDVLTSKEENTDGKKDG